MDILSGAELRGDDVQGLGFDMTTASDVAIVRTESEPLRALLWYCNTMVR